MYTRNSGNVRSSQEKTSAHITAPSLGDGGWSSGGGKPQDLPLLIPQDYHGEFLREHRSVSYDDADFSSSVEDTVPAAAESDVVLADSAKQKEFDAPTAVPERGGSLIGGLYDLLLGENSSEEETLLLLAIALFLLWGHLDRGDLFDRSTWDSDDLALLLIGYLLLS